LSSDGSPTAHRRTRYLVAGVAVASAGVIAINPVAPPLPDIQERAVQLTAIANPITPWAQTIATTLENLGKLTTGSATSSTAMAQALSNPAIYTELVNIVIANVTNPLPLLTELRNFQSNYGEAISTASQASLAALQTSLANLPTVLNNTVNYLATGQFVEAFSELNIYFLVQLLERPARPLFPLLTIPGDIAAAIPGAERLPLVLDALLTRGTLNGLTKAFFVAPITAALQTAEILDAVRAAVQTGDTEAAISELINMPAKVVNAFVNGYVPNFPSRSTFPGILGDGGPLDYFLVDLPKAIAAALSIAPPAPTTALAATSNAALAPSSPTDTAISGDTVTLTVDSASITEAALETGSTTTDSTDPRPDVDSSGTGGDADEPTTSETDDNADNATDDTDTDAGSDAETDADESDDDRTSGGVNSGTESSESGSAGTSDTGTSGDSDSGDGDSDGSGSGDSDSGSSGGDE
jgi:hypothetical protein